MANQVTIIFLVIVNFILINGSCAITEKQLQRRHAVPVLYLKGTHYEVGFDTGRIFASVIRNFIDSYENLRDFERQYNTPAGRDAYDVTLKNMKSRYPQYVNEIQGVADGANVSFYQLFLLQMDDLIATINENQVIRNDTGGCSSIAFNNMGKTILGHTEDAFSETLNHFYIMSAHIIPSEEDRERGAVEERFASLCYAGNLPGYTMGYNENGLVFSINTLSPLILKPGNTPRTYITRALLASKNYEDAERILTDEGLGIGNGFSCNMIWTDSRGTKKLYNFEVAPDLKADKSMVNIQQLSKDPLVHCNLYQRSNVTEVIGPIIDSSSARLKMIKGYPTPTSKEDIMKILSDSSGKEYTIFQDKKESVIQTIAVGIFDLQEYTWSIYIDKPHTSEPVAVLPIKFSGLNH